MELSVFYLRARSLWVYLAVASLLTLGGLPSPVQAKKELTTLRIMVLDQAGEPVSRASVVVTRVKGEGKKLKPKGQSLQLKTSTQGSAPLPPLDQGSYMVQVISSGYQTFGGRIELDQTEQTYTVTLEPPQDQFSVHTSEK